MNFLVTLLLAVSAVVAGSNEYQQKRPEQITVSSKNNSIVWLYIGLGDVGITLTEALTKKGHQDIQIKEYFRTLSEEIKQVYSVTEAQLPERNRTKAIQRLLMNFIEKYQLQEYFRQNQKHVNQFSLQAATSFVSRYPTSLPVNGSSTSESSNGNNVNWVVGGLGEFSVKVFQTLKQRGYTTQQIHQAFQSLAKEIIQAYRTHGNDSKAIGEVLLKFIHHHRLNDNANTLMFNVNLEEISGSFAEKYPSAPGVNSQSQGSAFSTNTASSSTSNHGHLQQPHHESNNGLATGLTGAGVGFSFGSHGTHPSQTSGQHHEQGYHQQATSNHNSNENKPHKNPSGFSFSSSLSASGNKPNQQEILSGNTNGNNGYNAHGNNQQHSEQHSGLALGVELAPAYSGLHGSQSHYGSSNSHTGYYGFNSQKPNNQYSNNNQFSLGELSSGQGSSGQGSSGQGSSGFSSGLGSSESLGLGGNLALGVSHPHGSKPQTSNENQGSNSQLSFSSNAGSGSHRPEASFHFGNMGSSVVPGTTGSGALNTGLATQGTNSFSGSVGVGSGSGSVGLGAGSGSVGAGAGSGSVGLGAGSGSVGVGAGSGSFGLGAGSSSVGFGSGSGGPISSILKLPFGIVNGALGFAGGAATGGIGAAQSITNAVLTPVSGALSFLGPLNGAAIAQGVSNAALGGASGITGGTINTIRQPFRG